MSIAGVLVLLALAQDPLEWKAGAAQLRITPETPLVMAGYGGRLVPYADVAQDIYAKALVLEHADGGRVAIVTSDLCDVPAAFWEPVAGRLREKLGLERERIVFNESHNHSGPLMGLDAADLRRFAAKDVENTLAWSRALQGRLADLVAEAVERLAPARLAWGVGVAEFVMNRREHGEKGVVLGANPRGPADRSVPVLRVEGADGKLRAVLFGAACHNTTLGPKNLSLSGDFAGFAQAAVEDAHPGATALFLAGCGADADPWPRGTLDLARKHGEALGREVGRVLDAKLRPLRGPLRAAADMVDLPLRGLSREELGETARQAPGWASGPAKRMLEALDRGESLKTSVRTPIAAWRLGELTMVLLSQEIVVDYVARLERALGPRDLWISAYCNDVAAYVPSARVLGEGGYETRGLFTGGDGFFAPEVEEVVVAAVRGLARRAGRSLP